LTTLESEDKEVLGDRLLEVLPGDGGSIGNLAAREALGRAAGREISEEDYEEDYVEVKERLVALGLVRKGRGRGGAIGLAEGIEGGSRYEAPAAPAAGNGRGRAKKEAPAKDFKAVLWASADKLRAQMDAAEYKHLVLGLIFLKYISDTFAAQQGRVLLMVSDPDSDNYIGDDPADHQASLEERDYYTQENVFWVPADARWESLRARAKQPEIGQNGFVLTPGRYLGAADVEDDGEVFEDKMKRLTTLLKQQQEQGEKLDAAIAHNLALLGFGAE
jgi:type I restriction enzyme M protein